jgi:hypothetical protein
MLHSNVLNSREAHNALKQALKYRFDNMKVWENFILVSIELHEITDGIYAYHRLLDLNEKYMDLSVSPIMNQDDEITKSHRIILSRSYLY